MIYIYLISRLDASRVAYDLKLKQLADTPHLPERRLITTILTLVVVVNQDHLAQRSSRLGHAIPYRERLLTLCQLHTANPEDLYIRYGIYENA